MKKMIALLALFSIILSLAACNVDGQGELDVGFNIAETKDILLGDEVNSVVLTTADGGKFTCDNNADFYEIFDNIHFGFENGIKCSYIAEIKLEEQSKSYVNMNSYHLDNADFYEFRAKKEGDDAIAVIEEYTDSKQLESGKFEMTSFGNYSYKEEKAFGGFENGVNYCSSKYPLMPEPGTELSDMHVRASYLRTLSNSIELFGHYEAFEKNGETYDFSEFVTREYKLYENYIVFKQTAPFLNIHFTATDPQLIYMQMLNSDCSITQEAYCNVETGKIEFIKIYGDTMWNTSQYGRKVELDIQMYIYDIDDSVSEQKIDGLIDYVKSIVE